MEEDIQNYSPTVMFRGTLTIVLLFYTFLNIRKVTLFYIESHPFPNVTILSKLCLIIDGEICVFSPKNYSRIVH